MTTPSVSRAAAKPSSTSQRAPRRNVVHDAPQRLAQDTVELSWLAPQVIAHRVHRMVQAGWQPQAEDQQEFTLMGEEKWVAFHASWAAMWSRGWDLNWQLVRAWEQSAQGWWSADADASSAKAADGRDATLGPWDMGAAAAEVLCAGLAPLRQKALSNAKRLGRQAK